MAKIKFDIEVGGCQVMSDAELDHVPKVGEVIEIKDRSAEQVYEVLCVEKRPQANGTQKLIVEARNPEAKNP